ncbi:hypothetical protein Pla108_18960 [Botrimarina colliarenosi]|uniref:Uncharacterized protein n=1 Tax=Botrimarina colliarenosi TaxID=2528001 RepID=A0A5C6ACR0_9BACT|nr:hypothetical protein Pla108_18960 [Botrimarina colliarenosi]
MIPAILTCVFVAWLYRSLNPTESSAVNPATADSCNQRLAQLTERVNAIASSEQRRGRSS